MNANDWLRKRLRNPDAGCLPLVLGLVAVAAWVAVYAA